jgi:single-strand DNA-binding protein
MPTLSGLARLGRDAEIRDANGTPVCDLALAFNVRIKNERTTTWAVGALWGRQAETLVPYLKKGSIVSVTLNDVHLDTFTKSDGTGGTKLMGRVIDIELGPKTEATAPVAAPPPPPPKPAPRPPAADPGGFDDIPF